MAGRAGRAMEGGRDGPERRVLASAVVYIALLVLVAVTLGMALPASAPDHDAIQALGAAHSLAAGTGYASPIPYYELQHAAAPALPVPQTIFPPGGAFTMQAAIAVGIPPAIAPMAVTLLALLVSVEVMRRLLRAGGCSATVAAAAAIAWLAHPRIWELVRGGSSEPAYIACCLLATLGVVRATGARRPAAWLLAAGLAGAAAVMLRYIGAIQVAALALVVAVAFRRDGVARLLERVTVFALPAALATAAMLARNRLLSGRLSGGQFEHPSPPGWAEALPALREAMRMAMALPSVPWASGAVLALAMAGLLAATAWALRVAGTGEPARDPDGGARRRAAQVVLACVAGAAAQAVFLAWNAASVATWFASWRYLLPLVPSCIVAVVVAAAGGGRGTVFDRMQGAALAAVALLAIGLVVREHGTTTPLAQVRADVRRALDARCGEETVRARIERLRVAGTPVLSTEEHFVHLETGAFVIGTTSRFYTRRIWTPAAVGDLMASFGAREVIVLRAMLPRRAPAFVGSPFHDALAAGHLPEGFEPVCEAPGVAVLRAPPRSP